MTEDHKRILTETLMEVLESIAYICPVPFEGELPLEEDYTEFDVFVGVRFDGTYSGKLTICANATLARIIAANILGVDENDTDAEGKAIDAIKELANILCGNLLLKIFGNKEIFQLGTPHTVMDLDELTSPVCGRTTRVDIDVEGNRMACSVTIKHAIEN